MKSYSGVVNLHGKYGQLTDRLEGWPQLAVDWLKQVIIIKIQDKLFKILKSIHDWKWAAVFKLVLLWGSKAFLGAATSFWSMVLLGSLVLLSLNVCHLHGRYLLLSTSLQGDTLLIQLLNAVALTGLLTWRVWMQLPLCVGCAIAPKSKLTDSRERKNSWWSQ